MCIILECCILSLSLFLSLSLSILRNYIIGAMTDSINRIIHNLQMTIPTEEPVALAILEDEGTWGSPPQSIVSKIILAKDLLKEKCKN